MLCSLHPGSLLSFFVTLSFLYYCIDFFVAGTGVIYRAEYNIQSYVTFGTIYYSTMKIRGEILTSPEGQCVSGRLLGTDHAWLYPQAPIRYSQAQAIGGS